jgi:site-specific recombinase XerD
MHLPNELTASHSEVPFDNEVRICKASLPYFGGKNIRQIKAPDVEKFKSYRANLDTQHDTPRKPATVLRELSIISKVFPLAITNDFLEYNPCSRCKKPEFDNIQNKVLSEKDEEKFFAEFESDWARDVCRLVLYTGLRQNDALGLAKFNAEKTFCENLLIALKNKIVPKSYHLPKRKSTCLRKCLIIFGGDEEGRTPDPGIPNG